MKRNLWLDVSFGALAAVLAITLMVSGCGEEVASEYRQIERLARPGINELLVLSNTNHAAFNSIPPTSDLDTANAAVAAVLGDITVVLGKIREFAVNAGFANAPSVNNIAGGFLPDVMRIDTSEGVAKGGYGANAVGQVSPTDVPDPLMLIGGRRIKDDVINVSYWYLITGLDAGSQAAADDGVSYCGNNLAQGHKPLFGQGGTCAAPTGNPQFPFLPNPY